MHNKKIVLRKTLKEDDRSLNIEFGKF